MSRALAIVVCVGLIGCAAAAPPPPVAVVPAAAVTPGAAVRSGAPGESAVPARAPSSGPVAPTPAQDPAPPAKPPPAAAQKPVSVAAPKPAPAPSLTSDALVAEILASGGSAALKTVLAAPQQYRFQVLFGAVTTGATPALERRGYRTDAEYYFPASSMNSG